MSYSQEDLKNHILSLSKATEFSVAKDEWTLSDFEYHEEFHHCPCGQPIKELCHIENSITKKITYVGNVCVKKFMGINTGNLFDGLKRIAKDPTANANEDLIKHAWALGYIHESEYSFLMDTKSKRKLSTGQLSWKKKINWRILHKAIVRGEN